MSALTIMCTAVPAQAAAVVAHVDISRQRMTVTINGSAQYSWAVSTGRWLYGTPTGTFRPKRLERVWYSSIYDNAPMPYSVFFKGGYAIHGTDARSRLGRRASHGCVRLAIGNAAKLFSLIERHGIEDTRIVVAR
jgi:lipoprotein-anchoring transpeptidase ErfK/SrfK